MQILKGGSSMFQAGAAEIQDDEGGKTSKGTPWIANTKRTFGNVPGSSSMSPDVPIRVRQSFTTI